MVIIFRLATIEDIHTIAKLKFNIFKEFQLEHLLSDNFIEDVKITYQELYEIGKAQHFIKEKDGFVIACAAGFIKEDIPYCFFKEKQYGFIDDLYVEPNYRKNGYTRELTNIVLNWFYEQQINTIRLVASHNHRKLYESLGFKGTDQMVLHR